MDLFYKSLYKINLRYKADTQPLVPQGKRKEQDLSSSLLLLCADFEARQNSNLTSATFSFHRNKIEHHFQAVANHRTVKFFRRKHVQSEICCAMSERSGIASQTQ